MLTKLLSTDQDELLREERKVLARLKAALVRFNASAEHQSALDRSIEQLDELFLLVIVGEFNSGKSAFINALVGATVADQTGIMKVTFFNQPWLERRYRPGTRLMLQGKYQGRNRFRVSFHAPTGEAVGASGEMATYPATDGLSSTQILALAREWRGAALEALEPLPASPIAPASDMSPQVPGTKRSSAAARAPMVVPIAGPLSATKRARSSL